MQKVFSWIFFFFEIIGVKDGVGWYTMYLACTGLGFSTSTTLKKKKNTKSTTLHSQQDFFFPVQMKSRQCLPKVDWMGSKRHLSALTVPSPMPSLCLLNMRVGLGSAGKLSPPHSRTVYVCEPDLNGERTTLNFYKLNLFNEGETL